MKRTHDVVVVHLIDVDIILGETDLRKDLRNSGDGANAHVAGLDTYTSNISAQTRAKAAITNQ